MGCGLLSSCIESFNMQNTESCAYHNERRCWLVLGWPLTYIDLSMSCVQCWMLLRCLAMRLAGWGGCEVRWIASGMCDPVLICVGTGSSAGEEVCWLLLLPCS